MFPAYKTKSSLSTNKNPASTIGHCEDIQGPWQHFQYSRLARSKQKLSKVAGTTSIIDRPDLGRNSTDPVASLIALPLPTHFIAGIDAGTRRTSG